MEKRLSNDSNTGIVTRDRLREIPGYPKETDYRKGPMAVIECDQDIPCNPCEDICKEGAIKVGDPITNLPVLDTDKCKGCIRCISICPGLCIFVIDRYYTEDSSLIYIPYELSPLPEKDIKVDVLDRKGQKICKGVIKKVIKPKSYNKTSVVAMEVPKKFYNEARHFVMER